MMRVISPSKIMMRLKRVTISNLLIFLIILITILLLALPISHYTLSRVETESQNNEDEVFSPFIIHKLSDVDKLEGNDLKFRITELLNIKQSVSIELRGLEAKRQSLQQELTSLNRKLEDYKNEISHKRGQLERIQISVQQAKIAENEAMERNTPRLGRPKALHSLKYVPTIPYNFQKESNEHCDMDSCFDYSLCPISSSFKFYIYPTYVNTLSGESLLIHDSLSKSLYFDNNPTRSCIFVIIIEECSVDSFKSFETLPQWAGDGRNHILWLNCKETEFYLSHELMKYIGRAMVIHHNVNSRDYFRPNFDLVASSWKNLILEGEVWSLLPPIVPAKRKYLATYLGGETAPFIQSELLKIQQEDPATFVFQFSCSNLIRSQNAQNEIFPNNNELSELSLKNGVEKSAKNFEVFTNRKLSNICENDILRTRLLNDSTFSLIIPLPNSSIISNEDFIFRLTESLKLGAIPVILGTRFVLPFSEVIDWAKISISLPVSRITEIHYLLKSWTDADILKLRRNGRLVYENYMSTYEKMTETVLGVIRTRVGLPPLPYKEIKWKSVFNDSFTPLKLEGFSVDPEDEENLGPIEPPYPSPSFSRNYSFTSSFKYELWNNYFIPFNLLPFTPWEDLMGSDAKFSGSSFGFRPIGSGSGGSGKEFSEALGGNLPKEQFTVVMLTHEREQVLLNSLQRLYALPYLNSVVVVWNSPSLPPPELKWPDIGVPVHIVRAEKNSLNNRFLPFNFIETEAILSIDDDAHLRHDEIVFGFRVWRENRDRIVGFPGRYHALDLNHGGWLYNSNYSCELSMVLTGAAFYHKIYSYLYSYHMPEAIRTKVDELMNCEDIAMNFLVSHVTQKPPVKVTSRWTFRCPGCPVTLSEDDSHFQERHHCINFFTRVYGYTPLFNTQFRADSVLFKTRIPHDKQKCFKYI